MRTAQSHPYADDRVLTRRDAVNALGDEEEAAITAILALNPTYAEFHTALAWALGESDVMGEARRPLDGKARQIHEILTADEAWLEAVADRQA